MTKELLPCPFCGGTKIELSDGTTFRWRYVGCAECGTQMEFRSDNRFEPTEETWRDAAEAWNRRAPSIAPSLSDFVRSSDEERERVCADLPDKAIARQSIAGKPHKELVGATQRVIVAARAMSDWLSGRAGQPNESFALRNAIKEYDAVAALDSARDTDKGGDSARDTSERPTEHPAAVATGSANIGRHEAERAVVHELMGTLYDRIEMLAGGGEEDKEEHARLVELYHEARRLFPVTLQPRAKGGADAISGFSGASDSPPSSAPIKPSEERLMALQVITRRIPPVRMTGAAMALLRACEMEEQNEAIRHGKKGKAWSGDFVRREKLTAMAALSGLLRVKPLNEVP